MPPYRKRYSKRRFPRSRSKSRGRGRMGGSFMKRARTRAYANIRTGGLLAIERKFLDFGFLPTGLDVGGAGVSNNILSSFSPSILGPTSFRSAVGMRWTQAPIALNVIGQGDTGSDRDGRQVINDSIHLRGECHTSVTVLDTAVVPACAIVNLVLVLDTQTNGGAPAGSAVFVNPGDSSTGTAAALNGSAPFVNLSNSKRFRILKHIRRRIVFETTFTAAGPIQTATGGFIWSMDVPLKQMKTNYVLDSAYANGSGPTSASIGDNGLFLFGWSTQVVNSVVCSYNSRLRFRG